MVLGILVLVVISVGLGVVLRRSRSPRAIGAFRTGGNPSPVMFVDGGGDHGDLRDSGPDDGWDTGGDSSPDSGDSGDSGASGASGGGGDGGGGGGE